MWRSVNKTVVSLMVIFGCFRSSTYKHGKSISFGSVTVLVNMAFGQSCDTNKITGCLTTVTDTITNDPSIVQDQDKFCDVFQTYVDCLLRQACKGVSLPDSVKDLIRRSLSQYGINCNLNLDSGNGPAAGMSSPLLVVTSFFVAVGVFFAL